jgi:hypothetical protein
MTAGKLFQAEGSKQALFAGPLRVRRIPTPRPPLENRSFSDRSTLGTGRALTIGTPLLYLTP